MMLSMGAQGYVDFLKQNPPLPATDSRAILVKNVGSRISAGVERFLYDQQMGDQVKKFKWEFNVVDDPTVNAWCMPGGKIVFYTGILPVANGEDGVATIMGHEVAHAVAKHGDERMTQQLAIFFGSVGLDWALQNEPQTTRDIFLTAYGVGSSLGSLAYSRTHEYEADKLGMVFMAMAGYDPSKAISFWQKMAQQGGQQQPEFLSTHPNDQNRIKALQEFLPTAQEYYKGSAVQPGKSGGTIKL
jgi:predicted Zn-dependent protease